MSEKRIFIPKAVVDTDYTVVECREKRRCEGEGTICAEFDTCELLGARCLKHGPCNGRCWRCGEAGGG